MSKPEPFEYRPSPFSVFARFDGRSWTSPELTSEKEITLEEAAPALLYGQQAFDALTVRCRDYATAIAFRTNEHAARLQRSAARVLLPEPSVELFRDAVRMCVLANSSLLPPPGSSSSFLVRATVLGTGNHLTVRPGGTALLWVFGCPVGQYGVDGMSLWVTDTDRASPRGTGSHKLGGNYAPGFQVSAKARERGYHDALYLDPCARRWVTETNTSNVVFASEEGDLIVPSDSTVLRSITVQTIATLLLDHASVPCHSKQVSLESLAGMREAACVGNATGVRPVSHIGSPDGEWRFEHSSDGVMGTASRLLGMARSGRLSVPDDWLQVIPLAG